MNQIANPGVQYIQGHCLDELKKLPDNYVHSCVTSPPYWGMRTYDTPPQVWGGDPNCTHFFEGTPFRHKGGPQGEGGQREGRDVTAQNKAQHISTGALCRCGAWLGEHGMEPTIELYVRHEVLIFSQVRRVLRDDGTLWLNLGDCYATHATKYGGSQGDLPCKQTTNRGSARAKKRELPIGIKEKDLCGIPWRVAFALQASGWYLRSDIIWSKPNPMPESVTDRPTKSHEYLFLFTKSYDYFYDAEAIKETASLNTHDRTRNKRSVWTVTTAPFKGAHFATFPPKLITPCILAGTSAKGCCSECGAPWERVVGIKADAEGRGSGNKERKVATGGQDGRTNYHIGYAVPWVPTTSETIGWKPSCECGEIGTVPCVVVDPFGGSGTVGQVCSDHGRSAILIDLNQEYRELAKDRLGLFAPK